MAPSIPPPHSPQSASVKRHETNIIKKNRFFHAIDHRLNHVIIKNVCKQENVVHNIEKKWLNQRKRFDDAILRRTDKARNDRPKKMNFDLMNQMLDPHQNPVRDQSWSVQIEHFNLSMSSRILRAAFNQRVSRASRFKQIKIRSINFKNKKLRVQYGLKHQHHIVKKFFQYVHFSDEAHFDFDQIYNQFVLREEGIKYELKNMQSMPEMKGVKLHVAAFIS